MAEIYCTAATYEATPILRELDAEGVRTFVVPDRAAQNISDLRTPAGIVAVAPLRMTPAHELVSRSGVILVLADVSDPANAGSLLRSADAFGVAGVVFGRSGVDPYHPKVVRASMGAIFRLDVAVADPQALALPPPGLRILGLTAGGESLADQSWQNSIALVVGNERHGLGPWEKMCERLLAIPMGGRAESLSAAVAGSIALYEATRFRVSGAESR